MRPTLTLALFATTFLTPPGLSQAAPGDPLGPELRVNTLTIDDQRFPSAAMDAAGNFVVVWTDNLCFPYFQLYNAQGVPQGGETRVDPSQGCQVATDVAMDADGDFIIVSTDYASLGNAFDDVVGQRFSRTGVAEGGEFLINVETVGTQKNPSVAMDADGNFVAAWESLGQDYDDFGVFARRYNAAGVPLSGEFLVNDTTISNQERPALAMSPDGDFIVTWHSRFAGSSYDIVAKRYDRSGTALSDEFRVNTTTTGGQLFSQIAMQPSGEFIIAWMGDGALGFDIFAQRFDGNGVREGGEFRVNTKTTLSQTDAAIAVDGDGDFVVVWANKDRQDGDDSGVFGQRFDSDGVPQGGEFQVNRFTTGEQWFPDIAMDADGDFVVAWESNGDMDFYEIFAQRYQGAGPVPDDFTVDGRSDILWRLSTNGLTWLWQMKGFAREADGPIGSPDTFWQVRGLADFNADTKTDVLWRNTTTGSAAIWLMDGFQVLDGAVVGGVNLNWTIVGAGDFDGDDHADILWHRTDGAVAIWLMDGLGIEDARVIAAPPVVWQVEGVGDFDADARSDILWRRMDTGAVAIWKMDGFAVEDGGVIGGAPLDWEIEGPADFDGDAKWDILWHRTDGATAIWKMNGLVREDARVIGAPDPVWRVDGLGDTNGDRKSDIIWRHTEDATAFIWQMNGFAVQAAQPIGAPPLVWVVQ